MKSSGSLLLSCLCAHFPAMSEGLLHSPVCAATQRHYRCFPEGHPRQSRCASQFVRKILIFKIFSGNRFFFTRFRQKKGDISLNSSSCRTTLTCSTSFVFIHLQLHDASKLFSESFVALQFNQYVLVCGGIGDLFLPQSHSKAQPSATEPRWTSECDEGLGAFRVRPRHCSARSGLESTFESS